jgi:hypothetical protein
VAGVVALGAAAGIAVTVYPITVRPHTVTGPQQSPAISASTVPVASTRPSPIRGGYQRSSSYTVSSPVRTLIVHSSLGNVTVTGSQRSTVSVTERMRYSTTPPRMTRDLATGTLTLTYACPDESLCAASYDIQVPRGTTVTASNGNGQIRLSSLAGRVTAALGLGISRATGLASQTTDFTVGNGQIDAAFTTAPEEVHAVASLRRPPFTCPGRPPITCAYRPAWARPVSPSQNLRRHYTRSRPPRAWAPSPSRLLVNAEAGRYHLGSVSDWAGTGGSFPRGRPPSS